MDKTLGQVAFEAYRAEVVTAFNGDPIPEWDALDNGAPARRGWEAAAKAVLDHLDETGGNVSVGSFTVKPRPSNWQPLEPGVWRAPFGEPEPTVLSTTGAPHDGETVPVVVEDDDGR